MKIGCSGVRWQLFFVLNLLSTNCSQFPKKSTVGKVIWAKILAVPLDVGSKTRETLRFLLRLFSLEYHCSTCAFLPLLLSVFRIQNKRPNHGCGLPCASWFLGTHTHFTTANVRQEPTPGWRAMGKKKGARPRGSAWQAVALTQRGASMWGAGGWGFQGIFWKNNPRTREHGVKDESICLKTSRWWQRLPGVGSQLLYGDHWWVPRWGLTSSR